MPLLPAQIPDIPETRSEIVPARLARKVGPLFGVAWDDGPFGHRTWISDHSRITLSEIARGAPSPTRAQAASLADAGTPTDSAGCSWRIVDRIGLTRPGAALPNEIANATLNRFGPDTRAAVLLTAVNRLLDPVKDAVEQALALLVDATGAPLDPELRLAGWTVLIIETFRSQPALVAAGIGARTIQRELVAAWQLPLAPGLAVPLTRCEISAPDRPGAPSQPCDLEVVDASFGALRLDGTVGSALTRRLRRDEIVDQLLRRLRAASILQDASHLWISERRSDELVVEALVPPTQLTHDFVTQFVPGGADGPLPHVPSLETFGRLPALTRRALLIALLGVLRHIQSVPQRREDTRAAVVEALRDIAELGRLGLPPGDPARPVVRCRTSLMTVQTLRHNTANDLSTHLPELLAATDDCAAAYRCGSLDRGAAAEIIGGANIEVNIVRLTNATDPAAGLPPVEQLDAWLRASWQTYLGALEVDPTDLTEPGRPGLIGYHLHNYAAFLAGHPGSEADLQAAVHLFRDIVLPARELFVQRGGGFEALRHTLQVATRATTGLAAAACAAGQLDAAREWGALGLEWIRRAMNDPSTQELLAGVTERACRFALLAAATLLLARELDVRTAVPADADAAAELVSLARRWEQRSVGDGAQKHSRHTEVLDLEQRIEKVRAGRSTH
jgi:hypothetical protein